MPAAESLKTLKTELGNCSDKELIEICLKLAKLKTENKEMLGYLLFESEDDIRYADQVKKDLDAIFEDLNDNSYYGAKNLRKALRMIAKYKKFTRSAQGEAELYIYFAEQFLDHADKKTRYQPLHSLLHRSVIKADKLISGLHEDLQYDYSRKLEDIKDRILKEMKHWNRYNFPF